MDSLKMVFVRETWSRFQGAIMEDRLTLSGGARQVTRSVVSGMVADEVQRDAPGVYHYLVKVRLVIGANPTSFVLSGANVTELAEELEERWQPGGAIESLHVTRTRRWLA